MRKKPIVDIYNASSIKIGPRYPMLLPVDWPAALCDSCDYRMHLGGFISFLDFKLTMHPRCPSCSAQRTLSTLYGMPVGPVEEPWIEAMGCCVEPWEWLCAECGHAW